MNIYKCQQYFNNFVKDLGGIAAERIVYNDDMLTVSAIKDLYMVRNMIDIKWGQTDNVKYVLIDNAYEVANKYIVNERDRLEHLVEIVMEKKILNGLEIVEVCLFFQNKFKLFS